MTSESGIQGRQLGTQPLALLLELAQGDLQVGVCTAQRFLSLHHPMFQGVDLSPIVIGLLLGRISGRLEKAGSTGRRLVHCGGDAGGQTGVDPIVGVDPTRGDFHVLAASPCVNAGSPGYVPGFYEGDVDDGMRVEGNEIDIGADEVPASALP